jgi:hypothetical protein
MFWTLAFDMPVLTCLTDHFWAVVDKHNFFYPNEIVVGKG